MYNFCFKIKKIFLIPLLFLCIGSSSLAQEINNNVSIDSVNVDTSKNLKFNYKQLVVPIVLIGYGVWATDNDQLEFFNLEIKEEVLENIDEKCLDVHICKIVPQKVRKGAALFLLTIIVNMG